VRGVNSSTPWIAAGLIFGTIVLPVFAADSARSHFTFRTPRLESFRIDTNAPNTAVRAATGEWIRAWRNDGSTNFVEFGRRVVVQGATSTDLSRALTNKNLRISRTISSNLVVLELPDALSALEQAESLAETPGVTASYPVMKRSNVLHSPYAFRSNDPFFIPYFNPNAPLDAQWYLENRLYDGVRNGIDINVLAAWPFTKGEGVTVAVADTGLEMDHPDLQARVSGAPHFNFANQTTNAAPTGGGVSDPNRGIWTHGTSVAGLVAAEVDNGKGMAGVAPHASLASWLIFNPDLSLVSDESLFDMYQYASDTIAIQNHSWGGGNNTPAQVGPTLLEKLGIEKASMLGRGGLGTIMVRSAGNDRSILSRADDDAYAGDPRVITVAAVAKSGRATDYSEPGACVLVSAPGGGAPDALGLFTLDLVGSDRGVNSGVIYQGDIADYRWSVYAFSGTSAATPLVSGIAALMLSVNPNLGYRDVQHILMLSARHSYWADPDLRQNAAGLWVSHKTGYGIPDAGQAVRLAKHWTNVPPLVEISLANNEPTSIPDDGLRVEVSGNGIPANLLSIRSRPSNGVHPDSPTLELPLVNIGDATSVPALNLTNKGALIIRGGNTFAEKISNAAKAGAAFAVIYNYSTNVDAGQGGDFLIGMGSTDFSPIPAVFIGNTDGENLKALFQTNATAKARLALLTATKSFTVNTTLRCEHVGLRVQTTHPARSNVRITLLSPQGTRSVLQEYNSDPGPGPVDWTYWSTHHFLESSAGEWKVSVSDEIGGNTGIVQSVTLILRGTQIDDTDHDGLSDTWETARLGTLAYSAKDDPDGDGSTNAREQIAGTNPAAAGHPFAVDLNWWELSGYRLPRLTWPAVSGRTYQVFGGTNLSSMALMTNVPGTFPEVEWLSPISATEPAQFFRVESTPAP